MKTNEITLDLIVMTYQAAHDNFDPEEKAWRSRPSAKVKRENAAWIAAVLIDAHGSFGVAKKTVEARIAKVFKVEAERVREAGDWHTCRVTWDRHGGRGSSAFTIYTREEMAASLERHEAREADKAAHEASTEARGQLLNALSPEGRALATAALGGDAVALRKLLRRATGRDLRSV